MRKRLEIGKKKKGDRGVRKILILGIVGLSLFGYALTSYAAGPSTTQTTQTAIVTYNQQSVRALGNWEQQSNGTWVFRQYTGGVIVNSWIASLTEQEAYYYVGTDGVMLTNSKTPDGYSVDGNGVWRASAGTPEKGTKNGNSRGAEPNFADYTSSEEYYRDLAEWLLSDPADQRFADQYNYTGPETTLN